MATVNQKALYIIAVVKSVNKSLQYAIDIVCWYTNTDREQKAVENEIFKNW